MPSPPSLQIQIKKSADGTAALACHRRDGSTTWQRHKPGQSDFFVRHDLTHLAVETELVELTGFFRLLADGWESSDFGLPWPRGPLSAAAALVEVVVGLLDSERASRAIWSAHEFNQHLENHRASRGLEQTLALTEEQLRRIRLHRGDLFAEWSALEHGDRLNLEFR